MTYAQAKMIVWNDECYSPAEVCDAAVVILGTLGAASDDVQQASAVVSAVRDAQRAATVPPRSTMTPERRREADRVDGLDRDDLGESPDF